MEGTRAGETDVNGRYRFEVIPPGNYTVGFIAGDLHIMRTARVAVAQTLELDAKMKVSEDLVIAHAPESSVTLSPVSTNLPLSLIERLPVQRNHLATSQFA